MTTSSSSSSSIIAIPNRHHNRDADHHHSPYFDHDRHDRHHILLIHPSSSPSSYVFFLFIILLLLLLLFVFFSFFIVFFFLLFSFFSSSFSSSWFFSFKTTVQVFLTVPPAAPSWSFNSWMSNTSRLVTAATRILTTWNRAYRTPGAPRHRPTRPTSSPHCPYQETNNCSSRGAPARSPTRSRWVTKRSSCSHCSSVSWATTSVLGTES